MSRELESAYNALAEAIEAMVRELDCDEAIALPALELYALLVARIIPSQEHFSAMGHSWGAALDSRPATPYEAVEILARIRAEYMERREQEPVIVQ